MSWVTAVRTSVQASILVSSILFQTTAFSQQPKPPTKPKSGPTNPPTKPPVEKPPVTKPPVTKPAPTTPPAKPPIQPTKPSRDMNSARELARTVVVETVAIKSGDSTYKERLNTWTSEAKRCNLTLASVPACITPSYNLVDQASFSLNENFLFVSIYSPKNGSGFFNQLILVRKDLSNKEAIRVRLMITQKKYSPDTLREWLDNGEYTSQVEVVAAQDSISASLKRLSQAQDIALIYHALIHLTGVSKWMELKATVADALAKQLSFIVGPRTQGNYKLATIRLIEKHFSDSKEMIATLGRALLASDNPEWSEYGALLLIQSGVVNDQVRAKLWTGLKSTDAARRLSAVRALSTLKLNKREENMVLEMLADSSTEVREAVTAVIEKFNLDNSNLISIQGMLRDQNEDTRLPAMKLVARISSAEATAILIEGLVDDSAQVRMVSKLALQSRKISQREVPALQRQLYMPNPIFRLNALDLLVQIQTQEIRLILIPLMFDEAPEVRDLARKTIQSRGLREADLELVRPFLNNSNASFRQYALQLIFKLNVSGLRSLVLPMMFDESFDVREEARKYFKTKGFQENDISMLEPYLSNANPAYRLFAMSCIGLIAGAESQKILIPLMFDDVALVRDEARKIVTQRTLSNQDLDALKLFLEDGNPNNRAFALKNVARIDSDEATLILIEHMTDEGYDVRTQASGALVGRTLKANHFEKLSQVLNSKAKTHRLLAIQTLVQIANKEIETLLIERLIEENEADVQSELRKAIKTVREKMKIKKVGNT